MKKRAFYKKALIPTFLLFSGFLAITQTNSNSALTNEGRESFLHTNIPDLTPDTYEDVLSNNPGLSLIFFHAEWCSHCLSMTPIYQALQERWDGGRVYRANFDLFINDNAENSAMNVIIQEHVPALPTSVLLDKNMCVLGTYVGVTSVNDLYKNIELDTTLDTQCVMRTRYSFD